MLAPVEKDWLFEYKSEMWLTANRDKKVLKIGLNAFSHKQAGISIVDSH